jgi:hypothetical protein
VGFRQRRRQVEGREMLAYAKYANIYEEHNRKSQ